MDEIVKLSKNMIRTNKNWREHAKFYNELSKIVDIIPYTIIHDFYDQMYPNLIRLLKCGPDLVK